MAPCPLRVFLSLNEASQKSWSLDHGAQRRPDIWTIWTQDLTLPKLLKHIEEKMNDISSAEVAKPVAVITIRRPRLS